MKLNYINPHSDQNGGTAVPGCGTIHRSEIKSTLTKLSDELELPFNLNNFILGSTGKREYSGDIDLVLDTKWYNDGSKIFHQDLSIQFGNDHTARNGEMVHLKYAIQNFNNSLQGSLPRTGFVQIDFNFGESDWEKFYHYSAGENSAYKGAHRNLLIAAICSGVNVQCSSIKDFYDRPISMIRWKWTPTGLFRVDRHSIADGEKFLRKQLDTILEGPYTEPQKIASILFPIDGTVNDLESLETLMLAVKRNYGMVDCERIWKRAAGNFSSWKYGKDFKYMDEIGRYFLLFDK